MTLNSKEAASWLRILEHKIAFTESFSKGSHIRQQTYNLIVPRVPIIFEPANKSHLRELEEANNLTNYAICRARWIKPIERRRVGQTHAFTILTVISAECANILIRDGLNICGTRVRPTKQKTEPIQCMKCRFWGHFAGDCPAREDTCGTCGGNHCTSTCQNRAKLWCITCKSTNHASWDRNCPKFNRRCYMMDKRNPENSMLYFPMEQEWSQMVRPSRIDMDERFPGKYTVNSLPLYGARQSEKGPQKPRGRSNTPPPRNQAWDNRQPAGRPDDETVPDTHKRPNWLEEIADQLIREVTNDEQATPGAGRPN